MVTASISVQMAQHIVLMNLLAPLVALWLLRGRSEKFANPQLAGATAVQLLVLWGWHVPPALLAAAENPLLHFTMRLSLFLTALWFWLGVLDVRGHSRWRSIAALLITSKLFCLLGAILVFAPRPLYGSVAADQQMAGLLILAACPATYLLGGIILASRWFSALESTAGDGRRAMPGV